MPPFFTARGCSPNSAIARAADNLGYHRGSCGCSRSNRTVYSPRISIPTRRRRILDRRCHRGRRHTTRHNRTHGGNRNLGGVVRCLRGIHGSCSCFLSFGDELHLARLWRCGDVGFLEIARATRSGHGSVIPATVKDDDLARCREVLHVALHEHLGLLAVGKCRQRNPGSPVIALIVPPLPAASRPSNTMMIRPPVSLTQS